MAIQRFTHDGYGMLERNRVDPVNMESQCVLDSADFANGAEVGMIVAVDKAAGKLKKTGKLYGLLANSERTYDQFHAGLKNYHVEKDGMGTVLFLENGHTFTTNTLCYDDTEFSSETENLIADLKKAGATPVYAYVDKASAVIQISKKNTAGKAPLQVVKYTTMPDGQPAVKFIVVNEAGFGEEVSE